jgi:hypothetical protein
VLHWLHYLPHYKTLPEPASLDKDDALLRRRDVLKESALQIASYATRPDRKVWYALAVELYCSETMNCTLKSAMHMEKHTADGIVCYTTQTKGCGALQWC